MQNTQLLTAYRTYKIKVLSLKRKFFNCAKIKNKMLQISRNVEKYCTRVPICDMHSSSAQRTSVPRPPPTRPTPPSTSRARRSSASRRQTCNVTVVCHLLETALDKEWASQPASPWELGSKLCVVGHFQAFMRGRQSGGSFIIKEQNVLGKGKKKKNK